MFLTHLRSLRDHGEWADARLLAAVRAASVAVPDAVRELAHIRGAQDIWLSRIEQRSPTLSVWPELGLDEIAQVGRALDAELRTLLERLTPASLADDVAYGNSAGTRFVTPLGDVLLHLFTHGQYHRGKVNAALHAAEAATVGVDYILWRRDVQTTG